MGHELRLNRIVDKYLVSVNISLLMFQKVTVRNGRHIHYHYCQMSQLSAITFLLSFI